MSHFIVGKNKLLQRANRIIGQMNAIKKTLEEETDHSACGELLQLISACRGAMNGLMLEVIDGHIRHHICNPDKLSSKQSQATKQLLAVAKTYFK